MGFIAHSAPNYVSAAATYGFPADPPYAGPVMTSAVGNGDVTNQINGASEFYPSISPALMLDISCQNYS